MSAETWIPRRLGDLLLLPPKNGHSPKEVEHWTGTVLLGLGCLSESGFKPAQLKNAPLGDPNIAKALLREGDLLLSRSNTRNAVGFVGIYRDLGVPAAYPDLMMRLVPRTSEITAEHLVRCLQSGAGRRQIEAAASGTSASMVKLNKISVEGLKVTVPPLPEQHQISAILDAIDESIRKTEQIIAKLKQVKQGLLHDLLTRGIDDNGELRDPERHPEQFKDSPLGRIPKGWDVRPLKELLDRIDAGKSPSCPERPATGDEWGVLKVSAVRPTGFQAIENKAIVDRAYIDASFEVRDGDLLITRANTYELVGLTCLVENPPPRLLLSDKTLRLVVAQGSADTRFVFYVSQMPYVRAQIETHATGSSGSMKNIGQAAIREMRLKIPPRPEQRAIAEQLTALDRRRGEELRDLAKLRLLKTGLMEDLLTGRVRVTPLLEQPAP